MDHVGCCVEDRLQVLGVKVGTHNGGASIVPGKDDGLTRGVIELGFVPDVCLRQSRAGWGSRCSG